MQRAVALECDNPNDNYDTLRIERRRYQLNVSFVRKDGNTFSKGVLYSKLSCSRITVAAQQLGIRLFGKVVKATRAWSPGNLQGFIQI